MLREQGTGRFCREVITGEGMHEMKVKRSGRGSEVKYCRTLARTRVVEALPEIVDRFVEKAKEGSIPHVKALTAIGGIDEALSQEDPGSRTTERPRRSLAAYLMKEWRLQQKNRKATSPERPE